MVFYGKYLWNYSWSIGENLSLRTEPYQLNLAIYEEWKLYHKELIKIKNNVCDRF